MFAHVFVGTNDIDRSQHFYDAVFAVLGVAPGARDDDKGRVAYRHKGALFVATRPIDGSPASIANGGTIGFAVDSSSQADAWHRAGLAAGGTSCEDPPGLRKGGFGQRYLAYLRDPDGNKLCVIYRPPD